MASLQAHTFNAGECFFFFSSWSCDVTRPGAVSLSCHSFFYLSTCALFLCDLRTVHMLVVVTKPSGYYRKQTRHEQTWESDTHWYPLYTRLITSCVCGGFRLTLSLHVASERTEAAALCCLWTFWKGSSSIYKVLKGPRWGCKDV